MTSIPTGPDRSAAISDRLDPPAFGGAESTELALRGEIDRSCRGPVLAFYGSAVFWLIIGTILALLASIKLHHPRFLADVSWLTFGRVRPAHLDVVVYGWSAMAGLGTLLWLMCRLCRVPLRYPFMPLTAAIMWNIGVIVGTVAVLAGYGNSIEWIEFPPAATFILFVAFAITGLWAIMTFSRRRPGHRRSASRSRRS